VEEVQVERLVLVIRHNHFPAEMVIVPVVAILVVVNALVVVVAVLAQLVQMLAAVVVVMVVLVRHVLSILDLHLPEQCHQIGYQL
jgi:fatty acid desaturase